MDNTITKTTQAQSAYQKQEKPVNKVETAQETTPSPVTKDEAKLSKLGGACIACAVPEDFWEKLKPTQLNGPKLVDNTLRQALKGDKVDAHNALENFEKATDHMTRGELEETQDYIVKRMATEKDPEARSLLHDMYKTVESERDEFFRLPRLKKVPIPNPFFPFAPVPLPIPDLPKDFPKYLLM